MPARDAAGMMFQPHPLPVRSRAAALCLLGIASATPLVAWRPATPPTAAQAPAQLVRWTDAGHDWLLVADAAGDRVAVYDAGDGRPLKTLDQASGLGDVDRLVLEGRWLVVLGQGEPRAMRLPDLQPHPLPLALR